MENLDFDRKRDFGSLLEDSFKYGFQFLGSLLKYLLIYVGPLVIATGLVLGSWMQEYTQFMQEELMGAIQSGNGGADLAMQIVDQFSGWRFAVGMVLSAIASILGMLIVAVFFQTYRVENREPTADEMQQGVLSHLGKGLGVYILFILGLIVVVAVLAGIVSLLGGIGGIFAFVGYLAVIYIGVRLSLVIPALVSAEMTVMDALKTSWKISPGKFWYIFGGVVIISLALGLLVGLVGLAVASILSLAGISALSTTYHTATQVISGLLGLLSYPFLYGLISLAYFTLKPGQAKGGATDLIDAIGQEDQNEGDNF